MPFSTDKPRLEQTGVLAVREYFFEGAEPVEKVIVRIGFPKERSDGRYDCGAEIDQGDLVTTKYMNGVDAFEALQLALILIGTELQCIRDHRDKSFSWHEGKRHDLGFPTYPDLSMTPIIGPHE
jgi:hypothetical protein